VKTWLGAQCGLRASSQLGKPVMRAMVSLSMSMSMSKTIRPYGRQAQSVSVSKAARASWPLEHAVDGRNGCVQQLCDFSGGPGQYFAEEQNRALGGGKQLQRCHEGKRN
jgi:hypothetical protein